MIPIQLSVRDATSSRDALTSDAHHSAVNVALRVHPKALGAGVIGRGRFDILDEGEHLAVAGVADADTLANTHQLVGARIGTGLGIRHFSLIYLDNHPPCCVDQCQLGGCQFISAVGVGE
jgi:hypothetical protein